MEILNYEKNRVQSAQTLVGRLRPQRSSMAIEKFIKHGPHCLAGKYSTMGRCSCGAQEAMEELSQMVRPDVIKNIAEEIPQVNDLANAYEACCARNETVKNELTRLLLHIAPDVEPENDIVSVFWQVDNAVCGLLKESRPTPLAPDSSKAAVLSLPESVKVENALPAISG